MFDQKLKMVRVITSLTLVASAAVSALLKHYQERLKT